MSEFKIDFFEFCFLVETCIPPRPIARSYFWGNLTDKYWSEMTENERIRLFEWIHLNPQYKDSLEKEEETKIFNARFDPDNQYMVETKFKNKKEKNRVFKYQDKYYTSRTTSINEEYIIKVEKITNLKKIKI